MFGRLVQKELLAHLLDFRFITVFALCALLSGLSVYTGGRNYGRRLQEYNAVTENNRRAFQESTLDKGNLSDLSTYGYRWNRPPEVLSPMVHGLAGTLGRETLVHYQMLPLFEASLFADDPIHALFGVLDLAFIVKVVLSLAVLLFTYDAICGEKEGGTLRLYASFPIPRSILALAKVVGSTVTVLVPFVFAYLLALAVLALSPEIGLQGEDWMRMGALMIVFVLYLVVFAAFGLWMSALTHRRVVAFLGLLVLWTVWLFVVPNLATDAAHRLTPTYSFYDLQKQTIELRWEIRKERQSEIDDYRQHHPVEDRDALPEAQQQEIRDDLYKINSKWDSEYHARLGAVWTERRNQIRNRHRLSLVLSALSPLDAVDVLSMDLARTGSAQQTRMENAFNAYLINLDEFVQEKRRQTSRRWRDVDLTGFTWFEYRDSEELGECLFRNVFHILNLVLLAVLGFAGAYVAILRYDVR